MVRRPELTRQNRGANVKEGSKEKILIYQQAGTGLLLIAPDAVAASGRKLVAKTSYLAA
jgi:hypothetical protein